MTTELTDAMIPIIAPVLSPEVVPELPGVGEALLWSVVAGWLFPGCCPVVAVFVGPFPEIETH